MSKHYINEVGTELILDTGIVIGSAVDQYILFKDPAGAEGSWNASIYSSYSELAVATGTYFLKHTLAIGDVTVPGEWRIHAFVASNVGTWLGELVKLNIFDEFQ